MESNVRKTFTELPLVAPEIAPNQPPELKAAPQLSEQRQSIFTNFLAKQKSRRALNNTQLYL